MAPHRTRSARNSTNPYARQESRSTRNTEENDLEVESSAPRARPSSDRRSSKRLHVGIDAGTRNSTIFWDWVDDYPEGLDHRTATRSAHSATISHNSSVIASEAAIIPDPKKSNNNTHQLVFGEQLRSALVFTKVAPKNVIRLLKLGLTDASIKNLDPRFHSMLSEVKEAQDHILREYAGQTVNLHSIFADEDEVSEVHIGGIQDVLKAFFAYLIEVAKHSVVKSIGLDSRRTLRRLSSEQK